MKTTNEQSNERFFLEKMISEKIKNQHIEWEFEQTKKELAQIQSQLSDAEEYINKLESLLKERTEEIKQLEAKVIAYPFAQIIAEHFKA